MLRLLQKGFGKPPTNVRLGVLTETRFCGYCELWVAMCQLLSTGGKVPWLTYIKHGETPC